MNGDILTEFEQELVESNRIIHASRIAEKNFRVFKCIFFVVVWIDLMRYFGGVTSETHIIKIAALLYLIWFFSSVLIIGICGINNSKHIHRYE